MYTEIKTMKECCVELIYLLFIFAFQDFKTYRRHDRGLIQIKQK